ncbi:hypothetical protein RBB50_001619 [Rhinocladiella similis]
MPLDELEELAYINYNAARPQPIVPSAFFDVIKIRRLIDDATSFALRAANGTTSSSPGAKSLGLPSIKDRNSKLSRERIHRMREHATQKLAKAYRIDEIASSVAVMQGASALQDVAKHVLQRKENDPDAQYVHFFHEKIPSMAFSEHTSLAPLDNILTHMPMEPSTYRTRAAAQMLKDNVEEAIRDCTDGLSVFRLYHSQRQKRPQEVVPAGDATRPYRDPRSYDRLEDEDQPSSLELQLLFLRAYGYLSLACDNAAWAFYGGNAEDHDNLRSDAKAAAETEQEIADIRADARKLTRQYAKKALRDCMSFLSHLECTPGITAAETNALLEELSASNIGDTQEAHQAKLCQIFIDLGTGIFKERTKPYRDRQKDSSLPKLPQPPVYTLDTLFAAVPPADLPYPFEDSLDASIEHKKGGRSIRSFTEAVSYHPLLTDVVHSMLLCHCLIQTATKELARHAYAAARITKFCDGFPVFRTAQSPARADWIEILRRSKNWLQLSDSWDNLCAPTALPARPRRAPTSTGDATLQKAPDPQAPKGLTNHNVAMKPEQAMNKETLEAKLVAQEPKIMQEIERASNGQFDRGNPAGNNVSDDKGASHGSAASQILLRSGQDDGREDGIVPARADTIVRWILNAPPPSATDEGRRPKKKSGGKGKSKKRNKTTDTGLEQSLGNPDQVD